MNKKGFTLIELLVVVLIIGILAGIALPQYKMAVTKAKVASILPIMRRWKDALMEYKLQHGDYVDENGNAPDGADLGVNWPSDWTDESGKKPCEDNSACKNDYWSCTTIYDGRVFCAHENVGGIYFDINMYPSDFEDENYRDKIICYYGNKKSKKFCKALGNKEIFDDGGEGEYQL